MQPRLTSSLFVAALVRRVRDGGAFAYVTRKGDAQAGAIHVVVHRSFGAGYDHYCPAPPADPSETAIGGRTFVLAAPMEGDEALGEFVTRESRFDSDFWLVEIENWRESLDDLISIIPDVP